MMEVAIISDIHGNYESLKQILDDCKSISDIFCLGDVVGYGPNPSECISMLKSMNIQTLMGNHDEALVYSKYKDLMNKYAWEALNIQKKLITPEDILWLKSLPLKILVKNMYLVHGSPPESVWEYLSSKNRIQQSSHYLKGLQNILCVGHTHIPRFTRVKSKPGSFPVAEDVKIPFRKSIKISFDTNEKIVINPGSVGQPRDGYPYTSYCRINLSRKYCEFRRIELNSEITIKNMKERGFPEILRTRLLKGR